MTTETPTSRIARATAPSELGASESEHRDTVNIDALDLEAMEQVVEEDRDYLIIKRGLYYRPNILGYTGIKDNAGRYTLAEATDHADEVSGVSFVPEADAPDYSPACFSDIALSHLQGKHDAHASALKSSQGEADAWKARAQAAEAQLEGLKRERDGLLTEVSEITKALTGLTASGSEFFIRKGDGYVADIPACVAWVRRAKEDAHRRSVDAIRARKAAEAALQSAQAELTRMREALRAAKREMWDIARHTWALADFKNWAVIQQIDAALQTPEAGDA